MKMEKAVVTVALSEDQIAEAVLDYIKKKNLANPGSWEIEFQVTGTFGRNRLTAYARAVLKT